MKPAFGMTTPRMDLTPELVALCERKIAEPDPDPRWIEDDELRAFTRGLVARRPEGPFWIFAYGSLIWNPTFTSVGSKRGTARGWHRSFCLELDRWRGTPEHRGLMMALDHGGSCAGLLHELSEQGLDETVYGLVWREISYRHDLGTVRWLTVESDDGPVMALTFWAGPKGQRIFRRLPLEQVAAAVARACGHIGSNAAYLHNTVLHLAEAGIYDRNLWRLQKLVAREIRALHGVTEV
ncbi:MAG: gamma-glutamylcyclotransferase [Parvibaculaceae bacterium]